MKRIPEALRLTIAENLRYCREQQFPGKGGSKQCAEAFGVTQQQWSPWELGKRLPNETRLEEIATFFGTTVEWLRDRHDFPAATENALRRLDIRLNEGETELFFSRLERALSHPERGDIVVSITMKAAGRKEKRRRKSV